MKNAATTSEQKSIKGHARASLLETLGAVQNAVSALPETSSSVGGASSVEAFLLVDPVLSTLHRQLLDARANLARLIAAFGHGDAMSETLTFQIAALQQAYNERLAALRKKREEAARERAFAFHKLTTEDKKPAVVRRGQLAERRRNNGTLWLWAFLILRVGKTSSRQYGLVPSAA